VYVAIIGIISTRWELESPLVYLVIGTTTGLRPSGASICPKILVEEDTYGSYEILSEVALVK